LSKLRGMHLTPIGDGKVLLEPGEGLDPTDPDAYLEPLLDFLQRRGARVLIYDLKNVPLIDRTYLDWLRSVEALCRVGGVSLVAVSMRPSAAYALALAMDGPVPFSCALDVDSVK
jgi:anti-anti-sigma regulatory factor